MSDSENELRAQLEAAKKAAWQSKIALEDVQEQLNAVIRDLREEVLASAVTIAQLRIEVVEIGQMVEEADESTELMRDRKRAMSDRLDERTSQLKECNLVLENVMLQRTELRAKLEQASELTRELRFVGNYMHPEGELQIYVKDNS